MIGMLVCLLPYYFNCLRVLKYMHITEKKSVKIT